MKTKSTLTFVGDDIESDVAEFDSVDTRSIIQ